MAVLLLVFQVMADRLEYLYGITGPASYLDEAVTSAAFIGMALCLVRQRRLEAEQQQASIRSLNHDVRNALQSILYADHLGADEQQKKEITESVLRIERAVREASQIG